MSSPELPQIIDLCTTTVSCKKDEGKKRRESVYSTSVLLVTDGPERGPACQDVQIRPISIHPGNMPLIGGSIVLFGVSSNRNTYMTTYYIVRFSYVRTIYRTNMCGAKSAQLDASLSSPSLRARTLSRIYGVLGDHRGPRSTPVSLEVVRFRLSRTEAL